MHEIQFDIYGMIFRKSVELFQTFHQYWKKYGKKGDNDHWTPNSKDQGRFS